MDKAAKSATTEGDSEALTFWSVLLYGIAAAIVVVRIPGRGTWHSSPGDSDTGAWETATGALRK